MLQKIFKILVPITLLAIMLYIGYNEYKKVSQSTENPLAIIPTNAAIILQTNKTSQLPYLLEEKEIWGQFIKTGLVDHWDQNIKLIANIFNKQKKLLNNKLFISLHRTGVYDSGLLFSTSINKKERVNKTEIQSLLGEIKQVQIYDNREIIQLQINKEYEFFICTIDGLIFGSRKKTLVEDAIRQYKTPTKLLNQESFRESYNTINNNISINLIYNPNELIKLSSVFITNNNETHTFNNFSSWTATDLKFRDNSIIANGFSTFSKHFDNFSDILLSQRNANLEITKFIPANTTFILALTYNNAKKWYESKNTFLQHKNDLWEWQKKIKKIQQENQFNYEDFLSGIDNQAGIFNCSATLSEDYQFGYLKTKNSILSIGKLQKLFIDSLKTSYKKKDINKILDNKILENLFGDILRINNSCYLTTIEDYLFFANNPSALHYLIDNFKNENILARNTNFIRYKNIISDNSNIFIYAQTNKIAKSIIDRVKPKWKEKINSNQDSLANLTTFSFQMSNNNNMLMNNLTIFYDSEYREDLKERWYLQIDTSLALNPQIIYNHFTKKNEVLIQDNGYKIYLFTTEGELKWTKQLAGKIIENVSQLDYFKNGKLQLLFNTENQIHIIDRLGKYIKGFPKILPVETELPVALFDYDNNKRYRILIVGKDNNLYNFDKKLRPVKGWKYEKKRTPIVSAPKHFQIDGKDFILCSKSDASTNLLARNGASRLTFSNTESFTTTNEIQLTNNGSLYSITNDGKLWHATIDGNSTATSLPNLDTNSIIHVSKLDNIIISDTEKANQLFYSNSNFLYTLNTYNFESVFKPIKLDSKIQKIEPIKNKHIVVITEKSLYVINNYGDIIEGTPLKSENYYKLVEIEKNKKINIFIGKNNFLYNYELTNQANK